MLHEPILHYILLLYAVLHCPLQFYASVYHTYIGTTSDLSKRNRAVESAAADVAMTKFLREVRQKGMAEGPQRCRVFMLLVLGVSKHQGALI